MIKAYWEKFTGTVDSLSLRERALIFTAAAFLLIFLVNTLLLDPLLARQKEMSAQVVQQQEKTKEIDAQIKALLQAKKINENSPQRQRLNQAKQQLAAGDEYIQGRTDRLVPPERMGALLEQMLNKNGRLQLVKLDTLPVKPLMEESEGIKDGGLANIVPLFPDDAAKHIFKHGVQITVRGSYADMLDYLVALEHLPSQMFWGMAQLNVIKYPVAELTLTVYTLSLDKTWLRV